MVAMKIPPRSNDSTFPGPDEAAQKTADDRASDADEDRNDNPAWVLPGHDELCESPVNEAQKDPGENAHAEFFRTNCSRIIQ